MGSLIIGIVTIGALAAIAAYLFHRQLLARIMRLPPPRYRVQIERGLRVPMRDGLTLATDHFAPRATGRYPTILIRSPYGRNTSAGGYGYIITFFAHRFAERGYHVVIQDTRGRFDSDGDFDPSLNEKEDGLDTLEWLARQDWFNGSVGTWGASYLGIVQWAVAGESPTIKAMVPSFTGSQLYDITYPDGALDMGLAMRWMVLLDAMHRSRSRPLFMYLIMLSQMERAIKPAFVCLPVSDSDMVVLKRQEPFFQRWITHSDRDDTLWQEAQEAVKVETVSAPVHLIDGWYDFFLRTLLADYTRLKAGGHRPYLTLGPWHHFSTETTFVDLREGLAWFDTHLKGEPGRLREKPVRIYVMGAEEWRELDDWPPPATSTRYYLHAGARLDKNQPEADEPSDYYRYDPANPTPSLGGTEFNPRGGRHDNRKLEARPDVLVYTTTPLEQDVEVIGHVRLELYVQSSLEYTDFFGRLCDVYPNGQSFNVCDGLFRVAPGKLDRGPDGSMCIEVDMWATAQRFVKGHRIRLQVSSGAHPRWNRNLGTGEQLTGKSVQAAEQTILHDRTHPSALVLPLSLNNSV